MLFINATLSKNQLYQHKKQINKVPTVAYSSKLLFTSAPRHDCTKSIGKFPIFLQCSAYIVLGQNDDLGKINLKISWNHRVRRIR